MNKPIFPCHIQLLIPLGRRPMRFPRGFSVWNFFLFIFMSSSLFVLLQKEMSKIQLHICIHFPTYFSSTVNWLLLRYQIFLVRHYNIPRTPVAFPPPHLFPFYDISHARGEGKSPSHKSVQITPRSPSARFFLFIRTLHGGVAGSRVAGSSCNGTEDATMCGHFLQLIFEPLEGLGRMGGGVKQICWPQDNGRSVQYG